jgi:hypothetical protein
MVIVKNILCRKVYDLIDEIEKTLDELNVKDIADHDRCLGIGRCDGTYSYGCGFGTERHIMYLELMSINQEIFELTLKVYDRRIRSYMVAEFIIRTDNRDLIIRNLERLIRDLW